jgi:serine protease Do
MSVDRCSGRYFLLALSGFALSACSPSSSTAAPAPSAAPVVAAAAAAPSVPLVTGLPDFTALVEQIGPAVVNVEVTERRQSRSGIGQFPDLRRFGIPMPDMPQEEGQDEGQPSGEGSGFIVSPDGYILTNRHVVVDATKVTVKLIDRREFEAKVIGMDEKTDVAVIKIEGANLPTVKLGDPAKLKPGQWVVAIGSPFGMENTVTAGIVSATSRSLPSEQYVPFIQTDVAVNPGNSGGPLFNLYGEVVGINSQIYSPSGGNVGLSFAIPIDMADNVRQQLVATGKVVRGYLGVTYQAMTAKGAMSRGLDRPRGALVSDVVVGEAAEKAGIRPDDVILSVGGKPVDSEVMLPALIAPMKPGTSIDLEVWTEGKLRKVTVKVGENKEGARAAAVPSGRRGEGRGNAEPESLQVLGLTVRPLTPQEKQQVKTSGAVVVDEVVSAAAKSSGIKPGDIVLGLYGTPVGSVADLQAAAAKAAREGRPVVSLRVQRPDAGISFFEIERE